MTRLTLPIGGMSLVDEGLLDMDEPHGGDDWMPGPPPSHTDARTQLDLTMERSRASRLAGRVPRKNRSQLPWKMASIASGGYPRAVSMASSF